MSKENRMNVYKKGATIVDQCAHLAMEFWPNPAWHGSTTADGFLAWYHEERLYSVRHIKTGICCLIYASSPYDAIEKVKSMEAKPSAGDLEARLNNIRHILLRRADYLRVLNEYVHCEFDIVPLFQADSCDIAKLNAHYNEILAILYLLGIDTETEETE